MIGPMLSKHDIRLIAREKRRTLNHPDFARLIARHAEALPIQEGSVVGSYHALPDEADPVLLLERLIELSCHIAYPRVPGKNQALEFHRVPDGEVLAPGA